MRKYKILIILFLFSLSSGCLVERLLTFKSQLRNPVKYIDFNTAGVLRFKSPILRLDDIELLTGVLPTRINKNKVTYDFIRPDEPNYSFRYILLFKNKQLESIDYPDSFYKAIASVFAFESLALFGEAELPKNGIWQIENNGIELSGLPTKKQLLSVFGPPTFKSIFSDVEILHYHYKHPTLENLQELKVSLSFEKKTDQISKLYLDLPDRRWSIQF